METVGLSADGTPWTGNVQSRTLSRAFRRMLNTRERGRGKRGSDDRESDIGVIQKSLVVACVYNREETEGLMRIIK